MSLTKRPGRTALCSHLSFSEKFSNGVLMMSVVGQLDYQHLFNAAYDGTYIVRESRMRDAVVSQNRRFGSKERFAHIYQS